MEHRLLGSSGLKVPVLGLGTATFGGGTEFFRAWGTIDVEQARRLVAMCLEAGVTFFDTADSYSNGLAEEILGQAIAGRRHDLLVSTKVSFRTGTGVNDVGASRYHLLRACEASLRRLGTDYIDIYHVHRFDELTAIEETQRALDSLVQSGKVRYLACSNFSGWQLMKSLAIASQYGWSRYVAHQVYYSLVGREYEWELMPLARDQNLGGIIWSPLAYGRLTGKIRRNQPLPAGSRLNHVAFSSPPTSDELLYRVLDKLDELAAETGKTVAQIALNWVLQQPTVAAAILGVRDESQLRENLGAVGWRLELDQVERLNAASAPVPVYPYWHQRLSNERSAAPTGSAAANVTGRPAPAARLTS